MPSSAHVTQTKEGHAIYGVSLLWNYDAEGLEVETLLNGLNLSFGSLCAALVVGSTRERRILHLSVELNLWLGA